MSRTYTIENFTGFIKQLWPSYRCNDEMIAVVSRWDDWLSKLNWDHVRPAIVSHRRDFADGTKPDWGNIFHRVAGKHREDGGGANDFEVLLRNVRDAAMALGNKGVREWSDEDTWRHYCAANPHDRSVTYAWRSYLQSIDVEVPAYLCEVLDAEATKGDFQCAATSQRTK